MLDVCRLPKKQDMTRRPWWNFSAWSVWSSISSSLPFFFFFQCMDHHLNFLVPLPLVDQEKIFLRRNTCTKCMVHSFCSFSAYRWKFYWRWSVLYYKVFFVCLLNHLGAGMLRCFYHYHHKLLSGIIFSWKMFSWSYFSALETLMHGCNFGFGWVVTYLGNGMIMD